MTKNTSLKKLKIDQIRERAVRKHDPGQDKQPRNNAGRATILIKGQKRTDEKNGAEKS